MLLNGYKKELFRAKCNPHFKSLHCYAHLEDDISDVIPYLNTVFGGTSYQKNPPSVMFQNNGRLIAVHSGKIAINALKDEAEADRILNWITNEINQIWENRHEIEHRRDKNDQHALQAAEHRVAELPSGPRVGCDEHQQVNRQSV